MTLASQPRLATGTSTLTRCFDFTHHPSAHLYPPVCVLDVLNPGRYASHTACVIILAIQRLVAHPPCSMYYLMPDMGVDNTYRCSLLPPSMVKHLPLAIKQLVALRNPSCNPAPFTGLNELFTSTLQDAKAESDRSHTRDLITLMYRLIQPA
jgi:hypothetical protein